MNSLAFVLAAFVATAQPITSNFDKLSEPLLMDGLTTITQCVAIDVTGIEKLSELAAPLEEENTPETRKKLNTIETTAGALLTTLISETKVGKAIVQSLMRQYNRTEEEISEKLQTQMDDVREDLSKTLAKAADLDDLEELLTPKIELCDKAILNWVDNVKKHLKPEPDGSLAH